MLAGAVALAAWRLDRPVRLMLDRNTDMAVIGKRDPYQSRFTASVAKNGLIKGYRVRLYSNGGSSHDASFPGHAPVAAAFRWGVLRADLLTPSAST